MIDVLARSHCRHYYLCVLVNAATFPVISNAEGIFRTIALSGNVAAGTDSVYKSFGAASINALGDIVFPAEITGGSATPISRYGIWIHQSEGNLSLLAQSGQPVAGAGDGRVYGSFTRIVLNDSGQVAFSSGLAVPTGGIISDYGVWKGSDTSGLHIIAAFGQAVPGTMPPVAPDDAYGSLSLNKFGQLAFRSGLSNYIGDGIWRETARGNLQLLVRSQISAPGDPQGLQFYEFAQNVLLSDDGATVFEANLTNGATYQDRRSVYRAGSAGDVLRIGGPMDVIRTDRGTFTLFSASNPQLSSSGGIVFRAEHSPATTSTTSLVSWTDDDFRTIVAEGDTVEVDASIHHINSIGSHRSDRFGNVVFNAVTKIDGDSSDMDGIFVRSVGGDISHIALRGQQAPGAPQGHVFRWFGTGLNALEYAVSGNGQVAFSAVLEDSRTQEFVGQGLWIWDGNGGLSPLIQQGQVVDVDDGPGTDVRSVLRAQMGGFGSTHDGLPSSFNDRGQIVVHSTFSNGTTGILLFNPGAVPEPNTILYVVAALTVISFAVRPKRRRSVA